ncbi:hypothetical protein B0H11DRAFT_1929362 [Mycena galericulata]|nr:hypothetical protein B0H11DRAFT_1929362 [Mycena galericulata]
MEEEPTELVDDNWGGSQYDPEEDEVMVEVTPDLGDLIDLHGDDTRVGSMHIQYSAMRIEPTLDLDTEPAPPEANEVLPLASDEADDVSENVLPDGRPEDAISLENEIQAAQVQLEQIVVATQLTPLQALLNELPDQELPIEERTVYSLYGYSSSLDVFRLSLERERLGNDELDIAERIQTRRDLLLEHQYPISAETNSLELRYAFEVRRRVPYSVAEEAELSLILSLAEVESIEVEARNARLVGSGIHMSVSTQQLEYGADHLLSDAAEFVRNIEVTCSARSEAWRVHARALRALDDTAREDSLFGIARLLAIRELIRNDLESTMSSMELLESMHTLHVVRLQSLQSAIIEELRLRRANNESSALKRCTCSWAWNEDLLRMMLENTKLNNPTHTHTHTTQVHHTVFRVRVTLKYTARFDEVELLDRGN